MIINKKILRNIAIAFSLSLFLHGYSKGANSADVTNAKPDNQSLVAGESALAMVERFNMGSNLGRMAVQVSKTTQTYAMVVEKHGSSGAGVVVAQEVEKLVPAYQARWNQNLASAYSQHLSEDEMRSLAMDGKESPYLRKLISVQRPVGKDMKKLSSPVLTELVTKAMKNAIQQ